MRVTRVRKFPRKHEAEITLRVSGEESEQLCHAITCMKHVVPKYAMYPELQRKGLELLAQLANTENGVFWHTWVLK